ncbi:ABC transporter ATP-binding protein [Lactobacillus iners]|uniref:ABC transporter ATP-binding protein n=1 Tax=Lactobacillus iners TaxID=147802 RepID=UPI0001E9A35B|nr:ABC transporter ATP-binding protein [Lactobacillus iners]EFQ51345.1 ABC transporter, ATP-binding protein [Lactobacillus iners LEAF 3008A-a]MCT7766267.1 ABC transporter ATP-binding protein [Lactobacillus iners]MCT7767275.1 ABC transporter ATP-binding protein [Lactobacillus iners]MCT7843424.1 ABC transporter ATP-binding protein [Lactobacillus iners]MCT7893335.1 ABC transporter ATP-binding protein [Lactobacillus iners]
MLMIRNAYLSYPDRKIVLKNLNLTIKTGECVVLTGISGSGKSSILNLINGLATRYDNCKIGGEVLFQHHDIVKLELYQIAQLIASVFQNPKTSFFNVNTTMELLFFLENNGVSRQEMQKRLSDLLNLFPIANLLNRNIFELSGGERQILSIATAYISGVQCVLLDEPSANLDSKYIKIVAKMLAILKKRGVTLLVAEHRLYYLMDVADRVLVVANGTISQEYSISKFKQLSEKKLYAMGLRTRQEVQLKPFSPMTSGEFYIKSLYKKLINHQILKIRDLSLKKGNIYGVVGLNGSGKTSLIKALLGVDKKCQVAIYLDDKLLSTRQRIKLSSWVMQDVNNQLFTDSVMAEIKLGTGNISVDKINQVIKKLKLSSLLDRHPLSLSVGQKQRVAIASTILSQKTLLYFDEPTSGMDYLNMIAISKLLRDSSTNNNIIIIVSHDVEFLNQTVDHVIKLSSN